MGQADTGKRWCGEDDGRDALVVRPTGISLQEIGGHNARLHRGHRREAQLTAGDGVACCVDLGVAHALEVLVDRDATIGGPLDAGDLQGEIVHFWNSAGSVDDHIGCDLPLSPLGADMHYEPVLAFVDSRHSCSDVDLDTKFTRDLNELGDEIGVERLERPLPRWRIFTLAPARASDMGELKGDVDAADEGHPGGNSSSSRKAVLVVKWSSPGMPSGACRAPATMTT